MSSKITPNHTRLEALYEVSRALNSSLELGEALVIVIDAAIRLTGAERGFLVLADPAAGELRFRVARNAQQERIDESAFEVSHSVVQAVVETAAPVVTLNAQKDPRFGSKASVVNYFLRSIMAVPLRARGQLLGVLYVDSKTRHVEFKQSDLDLLTSFADQAATALVNAQLYEAQRQETSARQILLEVARAAQAAASLRDLAERLVADLPGWVGCDRAGVAMVEAETGRLRPAAFTRPADTEAFTRLFAQASADWPFHERVLATRAPFRLTLTELIDGLPAEWLTALQPAGELLVIPLWAEADLIGLLALDNAASQRPLPALAWSIAEALGAQLVSAGQRLLLFEASQRQLKELTLLNAVAGVVTEAVSLDELTGRVMDVLNPVFGTQGLGVLLLDDAAGGLRLRPSPAAGPLVIPPNQGIVGQVFATGRPVRLGDVTQAAGYLRLNPDTRSELCVPLRAGDRVLGVLNAESPAYHAFTAGDERLLATVAAQLATAVEKLHLLETERQQRELAEALDAVGLELSLESKLEVMLDRLLGHIARVVPYDAACVLVAADGFTATRGARGYERWGAALLESVNRLRLAVAETPNLRTMAQTGQPLLVADVLAEPGWVPTQASATLRSWLGAPVMVRGQAVAFLSLEKVEPGYFRPEQARRLAAFAGYAALALQNIWLLEAAELRAAELDAVRTASLSLTSSLDVHDVLPAILRGALSLLPDAQTASIYFYQNDRVEFGAALWADGRTERLPEPRPAGLTAIVARTGELVVVSDTRTHRLFQDTPQSGRGALIGLPLRMGSRVVGVMNVAYAAPRAIADAELRTLRLLGEQAAAAIENARLFDATRKQVAELTVLHAVALAGSESPDVDALLARVTPLVGDFLEARYFGIWLVDKTGLLLRPHASFRGQRTAALLMGEGLIGHAAASGRAYRAADVAGEVAYQPIHPGTRSQVCVPIKINETVIGILDAESERHGAFGEADERLLATVAGQLATAIERARLFAAERAARSQAETLREVAGLLNTTLERGALLDQILDQLARLVRYESASIMLLDESRLRLAAQRGFHVPAQQLEALQLDRLEHIRTVLDDCEPLLIADTHGDHRWQVLKGAEYIRCWLGVPLVVKGRPLGILNLDSDQPGYYSHHDAEVALALANQAAAALDRLQLWEATQQRERELAILLDVARAVSSSLELDEVLQHVALAATQTLNMDGCALSAYEPAARQVATLKLYTRGQAPGLLVGGVYTLDDYPVTRQVIADEQIAIVTLGDPASDPAEATLLRPTGYRTLLMLAVRASGRPVGLMELYASDQARQFSDADLRLARAIADQTGVALENARLFRAEREQRELAEALRQAAASLGGSLEFDAVLDRLLDQIASVVPYDTASLMLVDGLVERAWVARQRGFERLGPEAAAAVSRVEWEIARTATLQRMVETGQAFFIPDVRTFVGWLPMAGLPQERAWVGAPVLAQGGVVAFVSLDKYEAGFYQAKHAERLAAFAGQVGLALQNARLYAAERRRVTALTTLHDVALELGTRRTPAALQGSILAGAARLLQAAAGVFYSMAPESGALQLAAEHQLPAHLAGRSPALAEEVAGRVALTGETLVAGGHEAPAAELRSALGVPVQWRGQLLGVLVMLDQRPARFGEPDVDVIRLFADRAAIAYENVRLVTELEKEKQRLELLVNLSQSLASTLDPNEVALRAMDLMRGATGADRAVLYLKESEASVLRLRALSGYSDPPAGAADRVVPIGQGIVGNTALLRRSLAVPRVEEDARWVYFPQLDDHIHSAVVVPLLAGDALIGVVSLLGEQPHFYQDEHLPLLTAAAVPVALALQNAGLFAAEARRVHYLTVLNEITRSAVASDDLPTLLQTLADCLGELTGAETCYLTLWDEARQRPLPAAAYGAQRGRYGPSTEDTAPPAVFTTRVLQAGQPVVADGSAAEAGPPPEQAWLGLPLVAGDQRLGAAVVVFPAPHPFAPDEIQRGEQAAGQIALGLARARLFDETRRNAEELAIASDLLRQLSVSTDIVGQFAGLAAGLKRLAGCDYAVLALRAADRPALDIVGVDEAGPVAEAYLPLGGEGIGPEVFGSRPRLLPALGESDTPLDRGLAAVGVIGRATLPLRAGQTVSGLLELLWMRRVPWPDLNLALLSQIVDALALAVEKSRLLNETLRRAAELEAITTVSADLRAVNLADDVLDIIVDRSLALFSAEAGAILMPAADQASLISAFHRDLPEAERGRRWPLPDSLAGRVFQSGQPHRVEAAPAEPAAMFAPLRSGPEVIGVLMIRGAQRPFSAADLRLLNTIAEVGGNALQRARVLETLEQRVAERTRELARANEQLKELDRLKDQFVSNVSHELRTPLTAIKLHLGLLDKRGAEALPRYLPILQRETERLRRLIEDLLDLSRLRARTAPLQREWHHLDTLLAHVLALHASRADEREVSLRHLVNAGIPPVPVDQAQLTQVFTNLIANAVTYTMRGGAVTVSSQAVAEGALPGVAVHIHNDGPAIPAEDLPHLFTRFYRGQTARESGEPGTGLGLAICKEIVERHAGYIGVVSAPERGTTFTVWLPLTAEEASAE